MARPSRLSKTRHGVYMLRWVVPVALRDATGRPREVRVSLRTRELIRARILALSFNLAVERAKTMTKPDDNAHLVNLMTLTMGNLKVDINNDQDRRLFHDLVTHDPALRESMLESMRSGTPPAAAMAALVNQAKASVSGPAPQNPVLLKDALDLYQSTRGTLGGNRRSTAGEKRRTLELLLAHLLATGHPEDALYVHGLRRDHLLNFVTSYASRRGKLSAPEPIASESIGRESAGDEGHGDEEGLSARTVLKAIGHLSDFYLYAVAQNWTTTSLVDEAFLKSTEGLRKGAAKSKRSNSYALFTAGELEKIFEPKQYLENLNAADDFWAPLIALYTGARLGEIVVLEIGSIGFDMEQGVHLMEIREELADGTRATKNQNSVRKVPLPAALVALGFLDYHAHVQGLGAKVLFPHRPLNATRKNDPSKHVSRAFGEHLDKVDIRAPEKVFHSFRHTVITRLHIGGVPLGDAELIVGHAAQDAHARMSSASPGGGTSKTHFGSYVAAAQYTATDEPLLMRLRTHLDGALRYNLDTIGLREAARIVQERTVLGEDKSFRSGWHTNAKSTTEKMLQRVEDAQRAAAASKPGAAAA